MQKIIPENVLEITGLLSAGKTLIFPTETTYGLGCDATNQQAVDRIFAIKGRPSDKPLLIVVPTVAEAEKYIVSHAVFNDLANTYWPGALTIVGEYKNDPAFQLAQGVVSKDRTVAVRVTAHPWLGLLAKSFGRPIVATSANLAGAGEIYDPATFATMFESQTDQPDAIVDSGLLPVEPPTTIVSVVGGKQEILRQGSLKL